MTTLSTIFTITALTVIATIVISGFFSKIAFKIGTRNVTRRFGNTVLVVLGALVGSALISGSLVLSDSISATFLKLVEDNYGEADARISIKNKKNSKYLIPFIQEEQFQEIETLLKDENIDGIFPFASIPISPVKLDKNDKPVINAFDSELTGVDFDRANNFGSTEFEDIKKVEGKDAVVAEALAQKLDLEVGDRIQIQYGPKTLIFKTASIYKGKGVFGSNLVIINQKSFTKEFALPTNAYNYILISAKGGIEPENYNGEEFENDLNEALKDFESDTVDLTVTEIKEVALEGFGMKTFVNIFFVLSLFGIFAGILLIINLFSMLAEERKMEMGILRAIALTRLQLIKTFVYEGLIYSILSSILGTFVGLGIGYALVKSLGDLFASVTATEQLKFVFDFTSESLITAFSVGFLITIITSSIASFLVSRLNIVEAIRKLKKDKKEISKFKILLKIGGNIITLLIGIGSIRIYQIVEKTFENIRNNSNTTSPFHTMSDTQFEDLITAIKGYSYYLGVIILIFAFATLVNKLIQIIFKKEINKYTISIASIVAIVFTSFTTDIPAIYEALKLDSGIGLLFISGLILVISAALVITHNLNLLTKILNAILSKIKNWSSVIKISLRYPAANRSRTGFTLVMFAIIIYLIVYVSYVKATVRVESRNAVQNSLGGYELIVVPSQGTTEENKASILEDIKETKGVTDTSEIITTQVTLPQYQYKDLEDAELWDDPSTMPSYDPDDNFQTFYNALPKDYIKTLDMELGEIAKQYDTDEEVWEAIINDPNKIVAGEAFVNPGYGQQPELKVGDTIQIANIFGENIVEKEIIALAQENEQGGPSTQLHSHLITTTDNIHKHFSKDYLAKSSSFMLLADFVHSSSNNKDNRSSVNKNNDTNGNSGKSRTSSKKNDSNQTSNSNDPEQITKRVKKNLIEYNIRNIMSLDDLSGITISFIDTILGMFQGFLAFSLIVGTSGLAIIITRSIQERRQQIGMLRSLGFQRNMILASFFIESTFITLIATIIGLSMGTIGALNAFNIAYSDTNIQPVWPYKEIALICLGVYIASMLFALLPSLKASKMSPVEATHYPE
jgi:putative ABC transport system permease protein